MRVSKLQKAHNRQAILAAAAALFRERGFDDVTIAEVMEAAGLTHGGFYGHFSSKDDLIANALTHVVSRALPESISSLATYAGRYLSPEHRDDIAGSCVFSSLGSEAVRSSAATRRALTVSMQNSIDRLSATAPGNTPEERRRSAITSWAAMVGAVMLSRISDDPLLADEILSGTAMGLGVEQ